MNVSLACMGSNLTLRVSFFVFIAFISGPVLIKQDLEEAKVNVANRLSYFKQEKTRLDTQQKTLEKQRLESQEKLQSIQDTVRKMQAEAVKQASAAAK